MVEGWRRDRVTMLKAGGVEAEQTGDQNREPEIKIEDRRCLKLQIWRGSGETEIWRGSGEVQAERTWKKESGIQVKN